MSSHSSWPAGGAGGIGMGFPMGGFEEEPVKKFTAEECLDALVTHLTDHPEDVQNQLNLVVGSQVEEFRKLAPSITDATKWTRTATRRPTHDDNGEKLLGSDREVREFENDDWADAGHVLECKVTSEYGEIISVQTVVKW